MPEEMKIECVELSMTACEKYTTNYEVNFVQSIFFFCSGFSEGISVFLVGGTNDKRNNGQKIWHLLACCGW